MKFAGISPFDLGIVPEARVHRISDAEQVPVSRHFPPAVRDALVRAARTPIDFDPLARVKAINAAARKARAQFPELFQPDHEVIE